MTFQRVFDGAMTCVTFNGGRDWEGGCTNFGILLGYGGLDTFFLFGFWSVFRAGGVIDAGSEVEERWDFAYRNVF